MTNEKDSVTLKLEKYKKSAWCVRLLKSIGVGNIRWKNMVNTKFSYDSERDDLLLRIPNTTSKGSIEFGDLILDYNAKKELVGIQMIHASQLLSAFLEDENSERVRSFLEKTEKCSVDVSTKGTLMFIKILNSHVFRNDD